jgi:hypothetical protein
MVPKCCMFCLHVGAAFNCEKDFAVDEAKICSIRF